MRIITAKNYDEASKKTANFIAAQITLKPNSVIGLATGSTPVGTYKELIGKARRKELSFSEATSVNLDEYVGLTQEDPQSYYYFMQENLHKHTDIKQENVYLPNGAASDLNAECERYENLIESVGGIDLQLLGIGNNGHVGFNEPGDNLAENTYVVELSENTIDANKRFFEKAEDVPREALTMGIGTIMRARKVLMLITGAGKAEILKAALFGPITAQVPATMMRLHPDFTVIADEDALALVKDLL